MTPRSILGMFDGQYRLRVSRPGYDVTDVNLTEEQLAFDSAWLESANLFMSGSYTHVNNRDNATIYFGKTFDFIPCVYLLQKVGSYQHVQQETCYLPIQAVNVFRDRFIFNPLYYSADVNSARFNQPTMYFVLNNGFIK